MIWRCLGSCLAKSRCMEKQQLPTGWLYRFVHFPQLKKGSTWVGWMLLYSKILWVIMSEQEVAFFLHLISLLLWHWIYPNLHKNGHQGEQEQQSHFYKFLHDKWNAGVDSSVSHDNLKQYHRGVYFTAWMILLVNIRNYLIFFLTVFYVNVQTNKQTLKKKKGNTEFTFHLNNVCDPLPTIPLDKWMKLPMSP